MDPNLSTIIIAVITGIFSLITMIIQHRQDKVINKIDEQTNFLQKEKLLKQKLIQTEKEKEGIVQDIMTLILDSNLIVMDTIPNEFKTDKFNEVRDRCVKAEERLIEIRETLDSISREYDLVLSMSEEFQKELEKLHK